MARPLRGGHNPRCVKPRPISALLVGLAVLLAALAAAGSASAAPATASTWYWNPAWCKQVLQKYGIRLDDGRTFRVAKAYCVGRGGPAYCEWNSSHTSRDYSGFIGITRSPDGAVRIFYMSTTSRTNFRATNIRAVGREPNPAKFAAYADQLSRSYAKREHEKGCAPYRGG